MRGTDTHQQMLFSLYPRKPECLRIILCVLSARWPTRRSRNSPRCSGNSMPLWDGLLFRRKSCSARCCYRYYTAVRSERML